MQRTRLLYIWQYYSKYTEELINKLNKGDTIGLQDIKHKYTIIELIFNFNKITMEKINFAFNFYIRKFVFIIIIIGNNIIIGIGNIINSSQNL